MLSIMIFLKGKQKLKEEQDNISYFHLKKFDKQNDIRKVMKCVNLRKSYKETLETLYIYIRPTNKLF